MVKKQLIALALAGMSIASVVQAEEFLDNRWYVAPFGSFVKTGGDRDADDGWGAGLGVGKILNEHFNVELRGFYQEFGGYTNVNPRLLPGQVRAGGNWKMAGGTADLQYYFFRDKISPYAVLGAGAVHSWVPGDRAVSFIGEAGAGLTYELMDNLLLRGDVRYRYTNDFGANLHSTTNQYHDMVVNVGVVVPFGEKPKPAPKVVEPTPVAPVADCSTMDSDSDGVNDCLDKCPSTMAGSKVNADGCPLSVELKGVQFKVNSAVLTEDSKLILNDVAKSLIAASLGKEIEVQGHTSSEASNAYNMKLSQRRSQSVVNYLKKQGVTDKLYAKGYGEERPIADNNTKEGRAKNRRVELIWIGN